jgi:large subunit ribosomal protein L19
MAILTSHSHTLPSGEVEETKFGVGDVIRVHQKIVEGGKTRNAIFEGMVLSIKNNGISSNFLVRKIGEQNVGIEMIFPVASPIIEKIEVKRHGHTGVRQAKLYFVRNKSKREIEHIYSRAKKKNLVSEEAKPKVKKATPKKVAVKKTAAKKASK